MEYEYQVARVGLYVRPYSTGIPAWPNVDFDELDERCVAFHPLCDGIKSRVQWTFIISGHTCERSFQRFLLSGQFLESLKPFIGIKKISIFFAWTLVDYHSRHELRSE